MSSEDKVLTETVSATAISDKMMVLNQKQERTKIKSIKATITNKSEVLYKPDVFFFKHKTNIPTSQFSRSNDP